MSNNYDKLRVRMMLGKIYKTPCKLDSRHANNYTLTSFKGVFRFPSLAAGLQASLNLAFENISYGQMVSTFHESFLAV